jgi:predicted anti-sigma-YlaC factor YlaD
VVSLVAGNHRGRRDDNLFMECSHFREAVSARLDGEDPGLPVPILDGHLAGCASCRAWSGELGALHRLVRVRTAEPIPDLTAGIVDAFVPAPRRRTVWRLVPGEVISNARWALFAVALTQLVLAAPALVLGEDAGATVHVARELGAFDVALAVGLLVAAWQPLRAWGLLPVAAALALVMAGTAVLDLVDGRTDTVAEAHHLLDVAGVLLLWLVAREDRPGAGRRTSAPA